jgi:hypothetical protein
MTVPGLMARADEELAAARLLANGGFAAQAVSRAYYGAFYAAEAVLLELGETRSKHSGVVAAFVRLVVQAGSIVEPRRTTPKLPFRLRRLQLPLTTQRPSSAPQFHGSPEEVDRIAILYIAATRSGEIRENASLLPLEGGDIATHLGGCGSAAQQGRARQIDGYIRDSARFVQAMSRGSYP